MVPLEFRGSEDHVKLCQQRYVDYFLGQSRVLDIGAGRGEFLELLRERGIGAEGIDTDTTMVERCKAKGFQVYQGDALSFLEGRNNYFDGIFMSHVIEHIPVEQVTRLITACFKALTSGGRLVIITLNPHNIDVMLESFWLDLSHVRPYPLLLLESLLKEQGFKIIEKGDIRKPISQKLPLSLPSAIKRAIKRLFLRNYFGGEDIFVVGEKARSPISQF